MVAGRLRRGCATIPNHWKPDYLIHVYSPSQATIFAATDAARLFENFGARHIAECSSDDQGRGAAVIGPALTAPAAE